MSELIILIGLPASGKSSWCAENGEGYVVLSSDAIRAELGNEEDQSNNELVFDILHARLRQHLAEGDSVIIDACNINRKNRRRWIVAANQYKVPFIRAVVFNVHPDICIIRNSMRQRQVPKEVIKHMMSKFEPPTFWEGFTRLEVSNCQGDVDNAVGYSKLMIDFDQLNPHHQYDLFNHCFAAAEYVSNKGRPDLFSAAMLHDFGKLFTQSIDEEGIGHYRQHANVSAYYFLLFFPVLSDAALICYHMWLYDENMWASLQRKAKSDDLFLRDIQLLHEADLAAH